MVLSKRERYIGIITGVVLGLVVLCKLVIFPIQDDRLKLAGDIEAAKAELKKTDDLSKLSDRAKQTWTTMAGGHLRRDESEAESSMYNNIRDWAAEAQLPLASVIPERTTLFGFVSFSAVPDFRTSTVAPAIACPVALSP